MFYPLFIYKSLSLSPFLPPLSLTFPFLSILLLYLLSLYSLLISANVFRPIPLFHYHPVFLSYSNFCSSCHHSYDFLSFQKMTSFLKGGKINKSLFTLFSIIPSTYFFLLLLLFCLLDCFICRAFFVSPVVYLFFKFNFFR